MSTEVLDPEMTRKEAARYLTKIGVPVQWRTLARMGTKDNRRPGPPFYRVRGFRAFYKKSDLDAWAENERKRVG